MAVCLHTAYGWFCAITAELSSFDRDHTSCKAKSILYLTLYTKGLPMSSGLQDHFLFKLSAVSSLKDHACPSHCQGPPPT